MRPWLILLGLGICASATAENLIQNGDFNRQLHGFTSVSTRQPADRIAQTISVVSDGRSDGENGLQLKLSPETAREALLVQPLPLKEMQAAGVIQLKCKVRIVNSTGQNQAGNVFIRVRQWQSGTFLKNSAGLWLPFSVTEGLRGVLENQTGARTLVQDQEYSGKWYELTASMEVDAAATSNDLMITATATEGAATVFITDLVLQKQSQVPFALVRRPTFITPGQVELPLFLKINEPVTVKATLLQDGKVQEVKEQIFSCGNQEMLIPVKKIVSGNFELQLSAGEHQDNLQLTAEEDAFSE